MSATPSAAVVSAPSRTVRRCLIALLVVAALLRLVVICWKPESLAEDRDLYWGIAKHLAAGHGFANPDWGHPTAYRPPLYPLLLASILLVGGGPKLLAIVQIGLSLATVQMTWRLARRLGFSSLSLLSAAFVAFNPLLVQATSQAMTETLCAFLLTSLLLVVIEPRLGDWRRCCGIGVLFGLTALCRPTVWSFAVLASCVSLIMLTWQIKNAERPIWIKTLLSGLVIALTTGLTVSPWVIRNAKVFGEPIVTTTHGGYTLLLGNNDEAYRVEIAEPTGQPWDSREWQKSLHVELRQTNFANWELRERVERERDRWMSAKAWTWIRQHPREFAASCWLRVKRFWNVWPGGSDAGSLPTVARWGVAVFFTVELLLAAIGLCCLRREEWAKWWPLVLLVLSVALVHVVYWSNLRMRAPVEPVLALLAARGALRVCEVVCRDRRAATESELVSRRTSAPGHHSGSGG